MSISETRGGVSTNSNWHYYRSDVSGGMQESNKPYYLNVVHLQQGNIHIEIS